MTHTHFENSVHLLLLRVKRLLPRTLVLDVTLNKDVAFFSVAVAAAAAVVALNTHNLSV